jgi:hypothetical protein
MTRQFLAIPAASATAERVFSFAGLTLSDLRKSLLEGTLEVIMWAKWGSPSIPLGRGDLHMTHPELCDKDSISVSSAVSIDVHNC